LIPVWGTILAIAIFVDNVGQSLRVYGILAISFGILFQYYTGMRFFYIISQTQISAALATEQEPPRELIEALTADS
jgi:hypothetical protein